MTFDAFGRETTTVWDRLPATPGVVVDIWTNTYDDLGRLASVSSPTGEVLYEYDSLDRQIRVATRPNGFMPADAGDVSTDIRYTYDLLGRLASVQTWERNDIAVDADPATAGQQPETESYVYDVLGNLDRELNPDGTVTDYTFDDLNRLTDIDETRADGTKLSEYGYTLRADGKRDFAEEKFYAEDGSLISHTTFDWEYDAAGRLTDEIFTNVDGLLFDIDDYHTSFQYDLTGNRVGRTTITDTNNDGVIDEFADTVTHTDYIQDANDRITSETTYVDGSETTSTTYGYDHTQQTSKEVFTNSGGFSQLMSEQRFTYNVQGRLGSAITETFEFGSINSRQRVSYRYGTDGIRFIATEEVDNVLDPLTENWTVTQVTEYLIDARNHTGYQQVLEETVTDGSDNLVRKVVYTIGHDHISQTTFGPSEPVDGTTLVFHMDGHGSTRILTDLAGTIANLATPQIFHYTAYGQAVNFTMSEAATQYLYSGEQFDSRVGQQYLRARYYNQSTGAFNRLDPFFGNQSDPQSFHKYLYTHGDPISGIDPTGLYNTVSISTSMAMQGFVSSLSGGAIGAAIFNAAGRSAGYGFATGLFGGFGLFMAWKMKRLKPVLREAIIGTGLALSASIVRDAVVDGQLGSFTKYGSEAFEAFSWSAFNHAWDLFGQAQGDPDIDKSPDYLLKGALEAQGIWDELFAGFSVALAVGVDSLALLGAAALGDDTPEVRDAFKSSVADLFGTIIRSAISSIGSLPVGSQKLLRKVPGLRSLSHRQRVQFAENTVEIGTKLAFGTTPFEWVNDHVELLASESVDAIFDSMKTFRQ